MSVQAKRINKEEQMTSNKRKKKSSTESTQQLHKKNAVPLVADSRLSDSKDAVQRWIDFSTTPQREEDIRQHLLCPELRKDVCCTYICQHSPMSTKFIEEFMLLSTNLFTFDNYTDENKGYVLEMMAAPSPEEGAEVLKRLFKEHPENEILIHLYSEVFLKQKDKILYGNLPQERLDWFNIQKHQNVEPWFKEKYGHLFNNKVSVNSKTEMSYWENQ